MGRRRFIFVTVPEEESAAIEHVSSLVTYGWGAIPVDHGGPSEVFVGGELYLVLVKDAVRKAENLALGDTVTVKLHLDT